MIKIPYGNGSIILCQVRLDSYLWGVGNPVTTIKNSQRRIFSAILSNLGIGLDLLRRDLWNDIDPATIPDDYWY
jgi:hypothetical protein